MLPSAFTDADRAAGYRYELSVLQAEFSLTQVLDRPVSGRVFFEQVIRDNLDAGRPDQVSLIFDRRLMRRGPRATPGRFRTRVITNGVTPSVHIDYKNTKIKQYHKEGRALRTETTINNPGDFGIKKRLTHLPELREIGFSANRRLLSVQRLSHNPIRAAEAFTASPGYAWVTAAPTACSRRCWCSGCSRTGSSTVICEACSPGSSAESPTRSAQARSATTCAACALTDSSPASHAVTATGSPTAACTTPC
ncbi:hypothetical protein [Pseudonocardia sp. MH-G8]|uniref:hypothetical protein n=1 Tax=Pseudonocardia sp. MH-G8 TaxID=1854588 RepID=UPI0018E96D6E|nr:hypothetical protein [Pseudonocardia sp. MH-G8]